MPSERARTVRADGSAGSSCVCRSRTICRRCSSVRRNRYASAERGRIVATHVPLVREDLEGAQRVRLAEAFVPPAVDDLQQLDRELDVADAAAAALDLDVGLARGAHVLLEADLDASDLVDRRLGEHLGEHERGHGLHERASRAPGSPATGRALISAWRSQVAACVCVVPAHRVERPRQRAARATRTERRVDAERDPLGGRVGERADQGRRSRARPPPAVRARSPRGRTRRRRPRRSSARPRPASRARRPRGPRGRSRRVAAARHASATAVISATISSYGADERSRAATRSIARRRNLPQPVGQAEPFDVLGELGVELRTRPRGDVGERGRPPRGCATRRSAAAVENPSRRTATGERLRPGEGSRARPGARRRGRATRGPDPGRARPPGTVRAPATRESSTPPR